MMSMQLLHVLYPYLLATEVFTCAITYVLAVYLRAIYRNVLLL